MEKSTPSVMFFISLSCLMLSLCLPFTVNAMEKVYTLSYSPGTLFHQLVRDRTRAVYNRAGIKVEFIALPHNRSLISANEGIVDGDVGRVPSVEEKYPNLVRVNVRLMNLNGVVYTIRDDIKIFTEELLKTCRVGYVLGVRWPQKKMNGLKAITARDYPSLFEMLLQNRVDIVLATEASAQSVIKDLGDRANKIRKLEPLIFTAPIYHYLNIKNKAIIPKLEKALMEMNEEGYWDE